MNAKYVYSLVFACILLLPGCAMANAQNSAAAEGLIDGYTLNEWANAVHKAEGNDNYGIVSIKCRKGEECRRICKNTVRNNYRRWKEAGQNIAFVRFLGNRFAPVGTSTRPIKNDPNNLNVNWIRNVKYWLEHEA